MEVKWFPQKMSSRAGAGSTPKHFPFPCVGNLSSILCPSGMPWPSSSWITGGKGSLHWLQEASQDPRRETSLHQPHFMAFWSLTQTIFNTSGKVLGLASFPGSSDGLHRRSQGAGECWHSSHVSLFIFPAPASTTGPHSLCSLPFTHSPAVVLVPLHPSLTNWLEESNKWY